MGKDIDILKVITHADGGEEYSRNATKYPANEYCVGLKGSTGIANLTVSQKLILKLRTERI